MIAAFATCKNRVFLCMLFPMIYLCAVYASYCNSKIVCVFIAVFIGFLSIKYCKQDIKTITHSRHAIKQWEENEKEFLALSETVYFPCLNVQSINPFNIKDVVCKPVALGWFSLSPLNKGRLSSHCDFVKQGILIVQPYQVPPTHLQMSIERNYGIKTEPVVCYENAEYTAYKLVQTNLTKL